MGLRLVLRLVQLQSKDLFEAYVSKLGAFLRQKRLQSFKAFVLTGLQEDKDMVALLAMMVLMARSREQGGSREVELTQVSNSCETLKSGLPALCRCTSVSAYFCSHFLDQT